MLRRFVLCLAIAMLSTLSSTPARGAPGSVTTFDTVDAIEGFFAVDGSRAIGIKVMGITAGNSAPSTLQFRLTNSNIASTSGNSSVDPVSRCDRMAMLAMSKPGKFQLAFVETDFTSIFTCRLIVRTP
jgi:hypothetical protein